MTHEEAPTAKEGWTNLHCHGNFRLKAELDEQLGN